MHDILRVDELLPARTGLQLCCLHKWGCLVLMCVNGAPTAAGSSERDWYRLSTRVENIIHTQTKLVYIDDLTKGNLITTTQFDINVGICMYHYATSKQNCSKTTIESWNSLCIFK